MERIERDPTDNRSLGFRFGGAERAGRVVLDLEGGAARGAGPHAARGRRALARARRARVARGAERRRQDDPDRGARRPPRAGRRPAPHRAQRAARLPLAARRGARLLRHRAGGHPARHRPHAGQGARAARPLPVQRPGGREADGRPLRRRAQAPVARDPGGVGRERADPRRADQPPRHRRARGARGRAQRLRRRTCCSCRTTARCWTRWAPARSRSRTGAAGATRAAGRSTRACARSAARQARAPSEPPPPPSRRPEAKRRPREARRPVEERGQAHGRSWSARWRRRRRRCALSRTSWPTLRAGRARPAASARPSATRPPRRPSRRPTRAGRTRFG